MRKFVLVLVAALATSAMAAAPYVELVAGSGTGEVDVMYVADGTDANLPSGFGLTVSVSDGNIVSVTNLDSAYNIYPGTIDINATTGVVDDAGTPVVGTLPAASIILEMGALYERPSGTGKPANSGRLCTITVDTTCTVTVAGDDDRAGVDMGIVAQDYTAYAVSDTLEVTISTGCGCDGDFDGNNFVNATDITTLISYINVNGGMFKSVPSTHANWDPCKDLDGNNFVNATDITTLISYINVNGGMFKSVACPGPGI